MEIKYLKKLEANPSRIDLKDGTVFSTIRGMTEAEIQEFESYLKLKFSITDPNFKLPQAYREYLFLAGNGDYLFETGGVNLEYLQKVGDNKRESEGSDLPFPYCVMDIGGDSIQVFSLTDTEEDPIILNVVFPDLSDDGTLKFESCGRLSEFIEWKIGRMLSGKNDY